MPNTSENPQKPAKPVEANSRPTEHTKPPNPTKEGTTGSPPMQPGTPQKMQYSNPKPDEVKLRGGGESDDELGCCGSFCMMCVRFFFCSDMYRERD
ncbi:hypothetical protein ACLMJK_001607 [Lecanora helva]